MEAQIKALRDVMSCMDRHCAKETQKVSRKAGELQKRVQPINDKIVSLKARHSGGHVSEAVYARQMKTLLSSLYSVTDAFQSAPAVAGRNDCTARMCQPQLVRQFSTIKHPRVGVISGKDLTALTLKELKSFR